MQGIGADIVDIYDRFKGAKALARQQGLEDQKQSRMAEIGQIAGKGDYSGAASKALAYGDIGTGSSMLQLAQGQKKFDTEDRQQVAGALYAADTPEKWAETISYLERSGHKVDPEEKDFNNRNAIIGQALGPDGQLKQQQQDRSFGLQEKNFNADEVYRSQSLALEREKLAQGQQPKPEGYQVIGEDQFGKKQYGYPPPPGATAQPIPQPMGQGQPNVMDLHGDEFIGQLDPKIGNQVRAIIEGRAPYPTGMLLKTPYGQQLAAYVTQADPTFESANATARAKVQADFATGTISKTNNALNTAIKHMKQMSDSVDALHNIDQGDGYGPFTGTANTVKNAYLTASGDPRVTDFKSISGKVAEELTRAYRGAGGAEADISRELEILQSSNSPKQLHSAIAKMAELLRSKIEANEAQYQSVMGPMVKNRPMISKEAQEALDVISGRAGGDTTPSAVPPEAVQELAANPTPEMQQHFDEIFGQGAAQKALQGQ